MRNLIIIVLCCSVLMSVKAEDWEREVPKTCAGDRLLSAIL
ncbi:hypothetical protein WG219_00565 [Ectopseudomonas mendocina]|uniref:Uncharacterized protein n=1 Tax=Ectopseudomonas mendocina TaxID=300 RepID=A0ABZ2RLF6_ECTME